MMNTRTRENSVREVMVREREREVANIAMLLALLFTIARKDMENHDWWDPISSNK